MSERIKSLYIDRPRWEPAVNVDDFMITIGVKQSNSVYHVAEVRPKERGRWTRYYVKVYDSDLITALKRNKSQQLITLVWYKR